MLKELAKAHDVSWDLGGTSNKLPYAHCPVTKTNHMARSTIRRTKKYNLPSIEGMMEIIGNILKKNAVSHREYMDY